MLLLVVSALFIFAAFVALLPDNRPDRVTPLVGANRAQAAQQLPDSVGDAPVVGRHVDVPDTGGALPLMIRWSNWQPEFGPAIVYAREADLDGMLRMDAPVTKMVMVTSFGEAERMMNRADALKAAGVTAIGMNTENGAGMTPADEMRTLNSADQSVNVVARVSRLVNENGFSMLWGPVRRVLDTTSDAAIRTMLASGVNGIALQEQKFIETQPADSRIRAVNGTIGRYQALADEAGAGDLSFHVQIMHQRCPNLNNCAQFVDMLDQLPVDSLALWSNGPIPAAFVSTVRGE